MTKRKDVLPLLHRDVMRSVKWSFVLRSRPLKMCCLYNHYNAHRCYACLGSSIESSDLQPDFMEVFKRLAPQCWILATSMRPAQNYATMTP